MRTNHPPRITAYAIMGEIGNTTLSNFIRDIPADQFSSHHFIELFTTHFSTEYQQMLQAYSDIEEIDQCNKKVANAIGRYLGNNQNSLHIEKVGTERSKNINETISSASLWRKIM